MPFPVGEKSSICIEENFQNTLFFSQLSQSGDLLLWFSVRLNRDTHTLSLSFLAHLLLWFFVRLTGVLELGNRLSLSFPFFVRGK